MVKKTSVKGLAVTAHPVHLLSAGVIKIKINVIQQRVFQQQHPV